MLGGHMDKELDFKDTTFNNITTNSEEEKGPRTTTRDGEKNHR
jgi:hypothetical protein